MRRTIFTLLIGVLFTGMISAQSTRVGVVKKATTAPVIDGLVDDVWATANEYPADLPFKTETPSLPEQGASTSTWKALWDDNGIYVLVSVNDDIFSPFYACASGCNESYKYDKVEIYFNWNYVLTGGGGGQASGANGKRQFAPDLNKDFIASGTDNSDAKGFVWGQSVNDPNYIMEYFIPWSLALDKDGNDYLKTNPMGFDVSISDNDLTGAATRNRDVWSNDGTGSAADESWNNMDDCGTITLDGVDAVVLAESVAINEQSAAITMDNDTFRFSAEVLPVGASNKSVKWSVVQGTGIASISADGLLTARKNGTVSVVATTKDGTNLSDAVEVTISGQFFTMQEANMLVNGNFDNEGSGAANAFPPAWGGWLDGPTQQLQMAGGTAIFTTSKASDGNNWHLQFNQSGNDNGWRFANDSSYVVMYDAWADKADRVIALDFEDNSTNGYFRYASSTEPSFVGGEFDDTLQVEAKTFVHHITIAGLLDNSLHKLQFMMSQDTSEVDIDNVYIIPESTYAILSTQVAATEVTLTTEGSATTIETYHGTLQCTGSVTAPADATCKYVYWTVENKTGQATIDQNGLLTAVADGIVVVHCWAGDHQGAEKSVSITLSNQTGVKELAQKTLRIFPNPVTDVLNVELSSPNATVTVFNGIGQKVAEMVATGTKAQINVRDYAKGVYYVKVNNGAAVKFVK